jgi:Isopenicillin N synthase and related dioxygenases
VINKDEYLVQAGLLLEQITHRTIRANLHTVRKPTFGAKDNVSRFSTPFFLSPSKEVLLKLLPKFRSDTALREFPDMQVSDIQAAYFSKIFRVDRICSRSTQKQST